MVLEPGRHGKVTAVLVLLFVALVIVFFFLAFDLTFLESIPMLVVFIPLSIHISITYGRTVTMNKDGCMVDYFGFKKFYPWSGMKTKRYESYNLLMRLSERGSPYERGAVFSPHRVRKSFFTKAASRGILSLFPFSHIYVYFFPKDFHEPPNNSYQYYYLIDEKTFRKKMAEWGVELEDRKTD